MYSLFYLLFAPTNSMFPEPSASARGGTNDVLIRSGHLVWALIYHGAGTSEPLPVDNGVFWDQCRLSRFFNEQTCFFWYQNYFMQIVLTLAWISNEKQHEKTRGIVPIHPQTMAKILAAVWANKEVKKIQIEQLRFLREQKNQLDRLSIKLPKQNGWCHYVFWIK